MLDSQAPALGIIGGGRAAWAFGSVWKAAGWPVTWVALREGSASPIPRLLETHRTSNDDLPGDADVVLFAVSDRAIEHVAREVAIPGGTAVFHASGSLPATALPQTPSFSLHPFRALPPVGDPVSLEGALLVYEGGEECAGLASALAEKVGARVARITAAQKPLYHAAAVLAANNVAALLDLSESILNEIGLPGLESEVAALADTAIVNWLTAEGTGRFTGPVVRGDMEVLRRHGEALRGEPHRLALYRLLALELVNAMQRRGTSEFDARALARRVREALDLP